jgi:hypothetical protein
MSDSSALWSSDPEITWSVRILLATPSVCRSLPIDGTPRMLVATNDRSSSDRKLAWHLSSGNSLCLGPSDPSTSPGGTFEIVPRF